jgi:hypothetical protein
LLPRKLEISQLAGSLGGYEEADPNQLLLPQNSEARPQDEEG